MVIMLTNAATHTEVIHRFDGDEWNRQVEENLCYKKFFFIFANFSKARSSYCTQCTRWNSTSQEKERLGGLYRYMLLLARWALLVIRCINSGQKEEKYEASSKWKGNCK